MRTISLPFLPGTEAWSPIYLVPLGPGRAVVSIEKTVESGLPPALAASHAAMSSEQLKMTLRAMFW